MSSNLATHEIPTGCGLMVVMGDTAAVFGTTGVVHAQFFAQVKQLRAQHVKDGSPLSNKGSWP